MIDWEAYGKVLFDTIFLTVLRFSVYAIVQNRINHYAIVAGLAPRVAG